MTPHDRARVLLELVEDCLRNGKRDVAVEQLEKALLEERQLEAQDMAQWCLRNVVEHHKERRLHEDNPGAERRAIDCRIKAWNHLSALCAARARELE